jgi:hypothetical protein
MTLGLCGWYPVSPSVIRIANLVNIAVFDAQKLGHIGIGQVV